MIQRVTWALALWLLPAVAVAQQPGGEAPPELYDVAHEQAQAAAPEGDVAPHEGAEGHAAHVSLGEVLASTELQGAVVNFLLLIAIVVFLARKPLRSFLVNRRRSIEEGLAEAAALKAAAEKKYDEYAGRLDALDREIAAIRKEMVAAGEAERDRIVAEAEAKAARMRREADFLIEQQVKQLRVDLTREAVEAAIGAAAEVLQSSTSPSDQQKLAQSYLEQLSAEARQVREERMAERATQRQGAEA